MIRRPIIDQTCLPCPLRTYLDEAEDGNHTYQVVTVDPYGVPGVAVAHFDTEAEAEAWINEQLAD